METKAIAKINNIEIAVSNDESQLVPIKPICDALGIDFSRQLQKIKDDEDLCSTMGVTPIVAADGKIREMACLPIEFVFGWLFTINPKNVKPEAEAAVRDFRMKCYHALFLYFVAPQTFLAEKQKLMEYEITEYQDCQRRFKDAQKLMAEAKARLNKITSYTIEEWEANNRQLVISFGNEDC